MKLQSSRVLIALLISLLIIGSGRRRWDRWKALWNMAATARNMPT